MSYLVLARKWRPNCFADVVGQEHVLKALINGLDQDRLHHAFLFSGTRGVGKTTLARIFAKSLNCEQGVSSTPCGKCQSCLEVDAGRFVDLIEVDAASRTKVDDTRELLDNVQYAPSRGRYKVYLIDEVHMLSTSSFNALLKTLEEPPPHVKFLFATTDPQKLPVTILSRCLQFNLRRLDISQISGHLCHILQTDNIAYEEDAILAIAKAADGSMRDALSLLDQAISHGAGHVSYADITGMLGTVSQQQLDDLVTALIEHNTADILAQSSRFAEQGRDFVALLDDLMLLLQRIATVQMVPELLLTETDSPLLTHFAQQLSPDMTQLFYQIALHGKRDLPYAADPRSGFEMTLLRMLSFQLAPVDVTAIDAPLAAASPSKPDNVTSTTSSAKKAPTTSAPEPVSAPIVNPTKTTDTVQTDSPKPIEPPQELGSTLTHDNWLDTINGLKLTALARQLADNSAFVQFEQGKITLSISPELAHLASPKPIERLTAVLSKHLNQDVKLQFQENAAGESATLATERAEQAVIDQEQAKQAIANDPAVEALKNAFDARVIDNTIKPVK